MPRAHNKMLSIATNRHSTTDWRCDIAFCARDQLLLQFIFLSFFHFNIFYLYLFIYFVCVCAHVFNTMIYEYKRNWLNYIFSFVGILLLLFLLHLCARYICKTCPYDDDNVKITNQLVFRLYSSYVVHIQHILHSLCANWQTTLNHLLLFGCGCFCWWPIECLKWFSPNYFVWICCCSNVGNKQHRQYKIDYIFFSRF